MSATRDTWLIPLGVSLALLGSSAALAHGDHSAGADHHGSAAAAVALDAQALRAQQERIEAMAEALAQGGELEAIVGSAADFEAVIDTLDRDALEQVLREAQANPRAWAALGLEQDHLEELAPGGAQGEAERGFGDARVLIFASFAIPAPSLKALMTDAQTFGAQVVMRGFVENSVAATTDAMLSTFGGETETMPMAVDPTLFRLFDVQSVPVVVVLGDALTPCETILCTDDVIPAHDRLAGNVPLAYALERIAQEGEAGATAAAQALEAGTR